MITSNQDGIYFMRWLLLDERASILKRLGIEPIDIKMASLALGTESTTTLAKLNQWMKRLTPKERKTAQTYVRVHRKRAKIAKEKELCQIRVTNKNLQRLTVIAKQLTPELIEPDINGAIDYLLGNNR